MSGQCYANFRTVPSDTGGSGVNLSTRQTPKVAKEVSVYAIHRQVKLFTEAMSKYPQTGLQTYWDVYNVCSLLNVRNTQREQCDNLLSHAALLVLLPDAQRSQTALRAALMERRPCVNQQSVRGKSGLQRQSKQGGFVVGRYECECVHVHAHTEAQMRS